MTTNKVQCEGSYTDGHLVENVKHNRRNVTGECPVCGRRVAFVGIETIIDGRYVGKWDRVLGRHDVPASKANTTKEM